MSARVRDMLTVTAWVVGILWVARQVLPRIPGGAVVARFLP